jgi:hypothetical protein
MIRLNYYIRRKPELSAREFSDAWNKHGQLWTQYAEVLGLRRYVQVRDLPDHPMALAYRTGYSVVGEAYDGVSVANWAEIAVLEAALETIEGQAAWRAIFESEKEFIDHSRSIQAFGIDHPVINPRGKLVATQDSDLVRGFYFPEGLPNLDRAELQRHWIAVHGGLTHDFSTWSFNMRYFQVHRVDNTIADAMRDARGMPDSPNHFGCAEVWSCMAEIEKAAKNPRRQELFPYYISDIESFCDTTKGYFVVGKEHFFVDEDIYTLPLPQPEYS